MVPCLAPPRRPERASRQLLAPIAYIVFGFGESSRQAATATATATATKTMPAQKVARRPRTGHQAARRLAAR